MSQNARQEIAQHLERLAVQGTLSGLSAGELLGRFFQTRDEGAFAALVDRYGPVVMSVCRAVLRDAHDADDAFQATFLLLVRHGRSIRRGESLGAWLHRVARRVAVRARRYRTRAMRPADTRETKRSMVDARIDEGGLDPDTVCLLHEELDRLPRVQREAIVLCDLEGLSHTEAARLLRWPLGTVKGRLARGRRALRDRLGRRGVALTALGVAGVIQEASRAAITSSLRQDTIRHAVALALGGSIKGAIPAAIAALVSGESTAMFMNTAKLVMVVALTAGTVAGGAFTVSHGRGGKESAGSVAVGLPEQAPAPESRERVKADPQAQSPPAEAGDQLAELELEAAVLEASIQELREKYVVGSKNLSSARASLKRVEENPGQLIPQKADPESLETKEFLEGSLAEMADLVKSYEEQLDRLKSAYRKAREKLQATRQRIAELEAGAATSAIRPSDAPSEANARPDEKVVFTSPIRRSDRTEVSIALDEARLDVQIMDGRVEQLRTAILNQARQIEVGRGRLRTLEADPQRYLSGASPAAKGFPPQLTSEEVENHKRQQQERIKSLEQQMTRLREEYRQRSRELEPLREKVAELQERLNAPEPAPRKVKPGDVLDIHLLEALPGRPVSGECVVRPDGTISLGFYGDLPVAGLDRIQIKVKLIEYMKKFLTDESLGLIGEDPEGKTVSIPPAESNRVMVDDSPNYLRGRESRADDLEQWLDAALQQFEKAGPGEPEPASGRATGGGCR